jgi:hypothetical protein
MNLTKSYRLGHIPVLSVKILFFLNFELNDLQSNNFRLQWVKY